MTCHRDGARHCACTPELVDHAPRLELHSPDARAHAALRLLAAPLAVDVARTAPHASVVRGDVAALLRAAAGALPAASLEEPAAPAGVAEGSTTTAPASTEERPEPTASLPHRAELLGSLERALEHQRPGTTTALLFCSVGDGDLGGAVLGVVASRVRGHLRRSDVLAHCGGGRFVAVLPDLPLPSGEDAVTRVVASVRDALREPAATADGLFPLRAVVGALVHPGGDEPDDAEAGGPLTAAEMLGVVERAMERGTLSTP
ncbi:diguanylate cyclase domain-containing protein [Streptomyces sp. NP160]|uniref:diguanylate cyclase domain-containing protein n=1 Tax=Streptomyces sp. NP160 TaxID=2586637 RepID=UPI0015D5826C|nr:diguanylate cyclase [Streptomyces sp. NP160]